MTRVCNYNILANPGDFLVGTALVCLGAGYIAKSSFSLYNRLCPVSKKISEDTVKKVSDGIGKSFFILSVIAFFTGISLKQKYRDPIADQLAQLLKIKLLFGQRVKLF